VLAELLNSCPSQEKAAALKTAADAHVKRAKEAVSGYGVDRHLYGLYNLAKHKVQKFPRYTIPTIFQDSTYRSGSVS
jgi:hypothetical protein